MWVKAFSGLSRPSEITPVEHGKTPSKLPLSKASCVNRQPAL